MKVFRGPRTTKKWQSTDDQSLTEWAKQWHPAKYLKLDGTIDKSGQRHTDLGVEFTEKDLHDLVGGLLSHYRTSTQKLSNELDQSLKTVNQLGEVLRKIHSLATYKQGTAPDKESLAGAIAEIADHFKSADSRTTSFKSSYSWLKWKNL